MSLTKCLVHCEEKFGFDLLQFHYARDSMTVFLVRNSDINKIIRQIIQAFWGYRLAFLAGDLAHKTYWCCIVVELIELATIQLLSLDLIRVNHLPQQIAPDVSTFIFVAKTVVSHDILESCLCLGVDNCFLQPTIGLSFICYRYNIFINENAANLRIDDPGRSTVRL